MRNASSVGSRDAHAVMLSAPGTFSRSQSPFPISFREVKYRGSDSDLEAIMRTIIAFTLVLAVASAQTGAHREELSVSADPLTGNLV